VSHPHPELGAPPVLPDGALRVVALGGLGEIGRNMTVFEIAGRLLIVDCGVLFPEVDQPGIDLILPDFSYIRDRLDDVEAVVLTHGHEDHLGAVPYLLRERRDIPILGSRFTLALLAAKLREHRIEPVLRPVAEEQTLDLGPFGLEFFAVNHSIPDALAVAIKTQAGVVLHTGDFKMDQLPLDGRLTDLGGFARLGRDGIDLLLSDSTNAEVPGFVTPEREIGPVVDEVMRTSAGRVIVACFASHVHRVQQVLDAAHAHGRSVAFVGRSMVRNMGVARDLGYLRVPDGLMIDMKDVEHLPASKVVLVSTGSQGEPLSALSRMANRSHHQIRIEAEDTVVLASSLIPGNENAVYRVINGLSRWGARVVHKGVAKVHVSGHAPAGELLYLLNATKPSNLMPVHGEWRHLRAHAELARLTGVPDERIVLAEDGVVVDLVDGKASIVGTVPCGYVFVDGLEVGDVGETTLKDRRILGDEGFISVTLAVDSVTGKIAGGPEIAARGFTDDRNAFEPVRALIEEELDRAAGEGVADAHVIAQNVRRIVGRWVNDTYRRRPMIVPVVIEV
jgi:ribonuclease J